MQRRLLISMVAVAFAAVLALGIPLGFVLSQLQGDDATHALQKDAQGLVTTLYQRSQAGVANDPGYAAQLARDLVGRYVVVRYNGRVIARTGTWPGPRDYRSGTGIEGQGSNPSVPLFAVTVEADDSYLSGNLTKELLLIGTVALAAVGVAVVLGLLYARRLARPLEELARAADRLGLGDTGPFGRRYGVQELDRVAEGLDGSAQRINDLLSAERDFAVDASHQLRTPLTALSMRLEEMMAAADFPDIVREEGAAALAQTERLTDVVGQLLGRARRKSTGSPTAASVDDIVGQQVIEWEPAFRRLGRRLAVAGEKGLLAFVTPGGAAQVIATLLDNALVHGAGTVTIRTSRTRRSVVIEVRDEGAGVPAELAPRIFERSVSGSPTGTGLGLALARTIAAADGGQVVLVRPRPAVFALFLPHATADAEEQPAVAGPA
jgi:signal transduction histidine kinase